MLYHDSHPDGARIDHVDVSSDLDHDKDYYDGLIDVSPSQSEYDHVTHIYPAHPRRRLRYRL